MKMFIAFSFFAAGLLTVVHVAGGDGNYRPQSRHTQDNKNVNFKRTKNTKVVVFGNSFSDRGRRFEALASFEFEGIGVYPWEKIYAANDTEVTIKAYEHGSVSNGKAWAEWAGVDEELNFATASASISDMFRSLETCQGYTGEGEQFPTGTLDEQIDLYLHDVVDKTSETLGYAHVILLGANDVINLLGAYTRYIIGQILEDSGAFGDETYEDPVPYEKLFEFVDSVPQFTAGPVITDVAAALSDGVMRLLETGVTGTIFIGNILSIKWFPDYGEDELLTIAEPVIIAVNDAILSVIESNEQLRLLDLYTLFGSIVDEPDTWTEQGFVAPEDEESGEVLPLGTPCFEPHFAVDFVAEIMGTQALRAADCQEECALCVDNTSPCQACYAGNPSATICDRPDTRIMWDTIHPTTATHYLMGQAINECVGKNPDCNLPFVEKLCPSIVEG